MHLLEQIRDYLEPGEVLFIQTHNFPDHDAVASAYGLQYLFSTLGVSCELIYEGEIQRNSLKEMIRKLNIPISHNTSHNLNADHKILIIDGCKGNKNVTDLIGDEIAVIDHHQTTNSEVVSFSEIISNY